MEKMIYFITGAILACIITILYCRIKHNLFIKEATKQIDDILKLFNKDDNSL